MSEYNLDVQRQIREIRRELDQLRSVQYPVRQTKIIAVNGVEFPVVQVPSANAYTLDDYRELAWTPSLLFGGAAVGMTYTTQVGWYTKWGRVIFAGLNIALSAKGASVGAATITGLPYAPVGNTSVVPYYAGMSGIANVFLFRITGAGCVLYDMGATGPTALTDTNFNNNSVLNAGLVYSI